MVRGIIPLVVTAAVLAAGLAHAETLYLRNGSRVEGRIQKQDETTFEVQTANGVIKVPRDSLAPAAPPNPWIVLGMGVALPGGGQAWLGQSGRGLTVAAVSLASGLTVGLGGQLALTGRLVGPDGSLMPGAALATLAAMVPWGLGAWEAWQQAEVAAQREQAQPRLRIEY